MTIDTYAIRTLQNYLKLISYTKRNKSKSSPVKLFHLISYPEL